MAKKYHGSASLNNRQYEVDVQGSPGTKIVVVINGSTVFDKSFNVKSRVDFQLEGRPAAVEWRSVGVFQEECFLSLGARKFLLQERDSTGGLKPPMSEEKKRRLTMISVGAGCVLFALFNFVDAYFSLRDTGYYRPKLLAISPFLLAVGTGFLLARPGWKGDLPRFMQGRLFLVVAVLLITGLGLLFNNWFISTFGK